MNEREAVIVLCPPISTGQSLRPGFPYLEAGFSAAARLLAERHSVHLIADGCTVEGIAPDWAASADGLHLSELGEYRLGDPIEGSRELSAAVRDWLERVFAPACDRAGLAAGEVFYASFAGRVIQPLFHAVPFAEGLAAAFPDRRFVVIGPSWLGTPLLRSLIAPNGGTVEQPDAGASPAWKRHFLLAFVRLLARAIAGQLVNFWKSRRARRFLAARESVRGRPDLWVALVPDWQRINQHVIDRVLLPALALGKKVGVFFIFTLSSGERTGGVNESASQGSPWPMIDKLPLAGEDQAFEQLVRPATSGGLARALLAGTRASLRIGRRLLQEGPVFSFGRYEVHLHHYAAKLAALATTDVLQVAAVMAAVADVRSRYEFSGVPVVFSSVGAADTAAADRLLSSAGATTFNFVHGALGDMWSGQNENCSDVMMVWTEADLQSCRKQGSFGALLPLPAPGRPPVPAGTRCNVLFITSYFHHDWAEGGFPWRPFLVEILRCRGVIESIEPGRFAFRWRPHPSDVGAEVARLAAEFPGLPQSDGNTLADDIDWADFVILHPSTTILDALNAELPVFLQAAPAMRQLPEVRAFDPARLFFRAEDLRQPFRALLDALKSDPDRALQPERDLRAALLGVRKPPDDIVAFLHAVREEKEQTRALETTL
ncbi:MAG: hypothetical protein ACK4NZ_00180 [Tsuneonella sp.]